MTPRRQLGVYRGGFPGSGNEGHAQWEREMGTGTVLLGESFGGASWAMIRTCAGQLNNWETWLVQGGRRCILTPAMIPNYGPDGTWATKKGTDAQVSAALARGAKGEFDSHWHMLRRNLDARPILEAVETILRIGHEPNGGWYAHRAHVNPKAWVAYFRRIVNIVSPVRGQGYRVCWNPFGSGGWSLRNQNGKVTGSLDLIWPGKAYVDLIGGDFYADDWRPTKEAEVKDKLAKMTKFADFARAQGLPLCFPEWGISGPREGGGDPRCDNELFIKGFLRFVEDPLNNVDFHIYFNVNTSEKVGDHKLTGNTRHPLSKAMFQSLEWRNR